MLPPEWGKLNQTRRRLAVWCLRFLLWSSNQPGFRHLPVVLRRINVLILALGRMKRAYNEIPLSVSIAVHAALFTFLILGGVQVQQNSHHLTWISFGGGLAASVTVNSVVRVVGRMRV